MCDAVTAQNTGEGQRAVPATDRRPVSGGVSRSYRQGDNGPDRAVAGPGPEQVIQYQWRQKAPFCGLSRNILDTKGPDTRFHQYLQGFRVLKKVVIMTCTKSALYAIMGARKAEG
jgi:hypothetical protein